MKSIKIIGNGRLRLILYSILMAVTITSLSGTGVTKTAEAATDQPTRPVMSAPKITCVSGNPQVELTWGPSVNAINYTVSRQPPTRPGWPQIGKNIVGLKFLSTVFAEGSGIYRYQVRATSLSGLHAYSNIVSANITVPCAGNTVPTPPTIPTTSNTTTPPPVTTVPTVVTLATTPVTTTPPPTTAVTTAARTKVLWGAYVGWQETALSSFETMVGSTADIRAVFVHWGNESAFPTYLSPYVKEKGKKLLIFWEATDYRYTTTEQPKFNYDSVINGSWDTYLKSFAASAKIYGAPVILIPYSEMNGDWFTWAGTKNGNTPAKHILAYRHIRTIFRDVPNVSFGWAPNNDSLPNVAGNQIEDYYPGDAYVDIVGVDGFNFSNPWLSFSQTFDKSLAKLKVYKKPIYIFSFASQADTRKASWITDALTVQIPKSPEITGWVWFNELKERDWRVNSDATSLAAFKSAVQSLAK